MTRETAEPATERERAVAERLLTPGAVREAGRRMLEAGLAGQLGEFRLSEPRLPAVAEYVADTIRRNYPGLDIPLHARWRHFVVAGRDHWAVAPDLAHDPDERARMRFDLAAVSVLLDAGAGPDWRWRDPSTGSEHARSEGLALASLEAFRTGLFSTGGKRLMQADGPGLMRLTVDRLAEAFQVGARNPLAGLEGRVALLNRLGAVIMADPERFGAGARIGGLYDVLRRQAVGGRLPAPRILELLLAATGPIWPDRPRLAGLALGDTWAYPGAGETFDDLAGYVPFHKLSQWLAYSLIEPLEEAGIAVTEIDGLTGLAEYRNGGLFVDLGVLVPVAPDRVRNEHAVDSPLVIEWRALTVGLLDRLLPLVRSRLRLSATELPLAAMLEGGTWAAGRRIAAELRPGGGPPLRIVSDGSVF